MRRRVGRPRKYSEQDLWDVSVRVGRGESARAAARKVVHAAGPGGSSTAGGLRKAFRKRSADGTLPRGSPDPPPDRPRTCTVRWSPPLLEQMVETGRIFGAGDHLVVTNGIPGGASIVDASFDGRDVVVQYAHDSDEVEDGAEVLVGLRVDGWRPTGEPLTEEAIGAILDACTFPGVSLDRARLRIPEHWDGDYAEPARWGFDFAMRTARAEAARRKPRMTEDDFLNFRDKDPESNDQAQFLRDLDDRRRELEAAAKKGER